MNTHHMHPDQLERYSFLWSEARLMIAAIALFIGGVPVLKALLPSLALAGFVSLALKVTWIVSGLASGYLLYRWFHNDQKIFGGKATKDTTAFFISIVSGINLGLAGLLNKNIGMSIISSYIVFILVGILYLLSAGYLYLRWRGSGMRIFSSS